MTALYNRFGFPSTISYLAILHTLVFALSLSLLPQPAAAQGDLVSFCAGQDEEAFEPGDICADVASGLWDDVSPHAQRQNDASDHQINDPEDNPHPLPGINDVFIYEDGTLELLFTHPHHGEMLLIYCLYPDQGCTKEHKPYSFDFVYDGPNPNWRDLTGFEVGDLLILDDAQRLTLP